MIQASSNRQSEIGNRQSLMTPLQVADRYGVDATTVLAWIHRGELAAVIVSKNPASRRPRFRIAPEALEAFDQVRTKRSAAPAPKRPRRRDYEHVI